MKHKTFIEKTDALRFAGEVQRAVDGHIDEARAVLMVTGNIKIIPAWIEWMQRYSVPLVIEPVGMDEENVVDTIEPPVEQEEL